jgi:hypothetical protein
MTEDVLFLIENISFSKEDKQRIGVIPRVDIPQRL